MLIGQGFLDTKLVGGDWNMNVILPNIGNVIIPIDSYFSAAVPKWSGASQRLVGINGWPVFATRSCLGI